MVEAEYRLVTEGLGVNHLRLVMGTSMGGMHTWLWGEQYPEFMDALMPLASLPTQISGRNRVWRRTVIDAIRNDPAWLGGNYSTQPPSLRTAQELLYLMSSNPVVRQRELSTLASTDSRLDEAMTSALKTADANDVLYQIEASVRLRPRTRPGEDSRASCERSTPPTISSILPSWESSSGRSSGSPRGARLSSRSARIPAARHPYDRDDLGRVPSGTARGLGTMT